MIIRKEPISNNRSTVVLDMYPASPRFVRPGLQLITKPTSKLDREYNKDVLAKARAYRPVPPTAKNLVLRATSPAQKTALIYWEMLHGKLTMVSRVHLEEYKDYLLQAPMLRRRGTISYNSASTYFACMKGMLHDAYRTGSLDTDISALVAGITPEDVLPSHFTPEEMQRLIATPCKDPLLKQMALFSAYTGARWSDVVRFKPSELQHTEDGAVWKFKQQKTGAMEYHPVSEHALTFAADFTSLDYDRSQRPLKTWLRDAGCTGSFHKFRHTCATTLIANGADVYVVSKLLGHKNVKTTQIYTEVADVRKRETINLLKF